MRQAPAERSNSPLARSKGKYQVLVYFRVGQQMLADPKILLGLFIAC
jgi:hypothetical protein